MAKAKKAETAQDEKQEELVKTQVGPVGGLVHIKGHPLKDGQVIELSQADIDVHREHGVALLDVPEDYDGEVYDVHTEWVNPEHEAA